jgi:hypothetical protein
MDLLSLVTEKFQSLYQSFVDAMPSCPLTWLATNSDVQKYLGYVNWFIPVYSIVAVYQVWLVCILAYYAIQVVLRWIKVIE